MSFFRLGKWNVATDGALLQLWVFNSSFLLQFRTMAVAISAAIVHDEFILKTSYRGYLIFKIENRKIISNNVIM